MAINSHQIHIGVNMNIRTLEKILAVGLGVYFLGNGQTLGLLFLCAVEIFFTLARLEGSKK